MSDTARASQAEEQLLPASPVAGLDPADWPAYRALAHTMLDEAMSLLEGVRERPVWQPVTASATLELSRPLPLEPEGAEATAASALRAILPFATGNSHPRFFGWVHGSGTPGGVIADMLAAAMNSNAGGRDHGAIHVERQVIGWCRSLFGLPESASGLLVSGTSMATLIALTVARNSALGSDARKLGLGASARPLVGYTSSEAHSSVARAVEMLGLGNSALRSLPANSDFQLDPEALQAAIWADKAAGNTPFAVIATAGTVNTGAIDPLRRIADICTEEGVWLHVDGAFGALAMFSDALKPRLDGIERADSIAFDFHKWAHVVYDAGCVLVRDGVKHRETFSSRPTYLKGAARGLAAGEPWPCDFGPELSRGFRALKVWFTLKEHGTRRLGQSIEDNCRLARRLGELILAEPRLELIAPVSLNIACFRFCPDGFALAALDDLNETIVAELQERGIAAPSTTRIGGKLAIRVNITNHRTRDADIELLISSVLHIGSELLANEVPGEENHSILRTAMQRPEIIATLGGMEVSAAAGSQTLFRTVDGHRLQLTPAALKHEFAAAVLIRHGTELINVQRLWFGGSGSAEFTAKALLAARYAALYLQSLSAAERTYAEAALPAWLASAYNHLAGAMDAAAIGGFAAQSTAWMEPLLQLSGLPLEQCRAAISLSERVAALNLYAQKADLAAPVEHLLTRGGDARIKLEAVSGRTSYGSSARPVNGEISFSSSTASSISAGAYASVEELRWRLQSGVPAGFELDRMRARIAQYSGAGRIPGTEIVLTASGTDAELAALCLSLAYDSRPLTSIVVSPDETGSGVPLATLGKHFSSETALGAAVKPGEAIIGLAGHIEPVSVAIRDRDGRARPLCAVFTEILAATEQAVASGRRVLLHVLDAAKTGIGAPALADVMALCQRFGGSMDVVVDACQARLGPEAVAGYLAHGWLIQITGSKFWGGPPFSGALLVPANFAARISKMEPLLGTLKAYAVRSEWPAAYGGARDMLTDSVNIGLLCRWQAALYEAECYSAVSPAAAIGLTRDFMALAGSALSRYPELLGVDGDAIDHAAICAGDTWHGLRTIVPFVPTRDSELGPVPLTFAEAQKLHRRLAGDLSPHFSGPSERHLAAHRCQLGQPVKLGKTAALRLCASVRTIAGMAEPGGLARVTRDIETVLAKTRLLLGALSRLDG